MAYCPNCGSDHIQLTTKTDVDWGRAAVGWALFGAVGGAVGAITGDDRKAIICLDCGTSWNPSQLHQIKTTIENLTNLKIDLTKSSHRIFVSDFISQMTPHLETIKNVDTKGEEMVKNAESDFHLGISWGCGFALLFSIFGLFGLGIAGFLGGLVMSIPFMIIGGLIDKSMKEQNKKKLDEVKFEVDRMKMNAKDELNKVLQDFMNNHPLD